MSSSYNIDTSLNVNGGLTINGDTNIPSSNLNVDGNITGNSGLYIAGTITGNVLTGNTVNATNIVGSTITGNTINGGTFNEGGTSLSSKYLGINATAINSNKFNGLSSNQFLRSDQTSIINGNFYVNNHGFGGNPLIALAIGDTDTGLHSTSDGTLQIYSNNTSQASILNGTFNILSTNLEHNGYTVWDSNNDGSGSGLDADKLDGNDSTFFAQAGNIAGHSFNYSATYTVPSGMAQTWLKLSTAYNDVVYLDIHSNYDNSQQHEHIVATVFGYSMHHHITSTTSDYNTGKLLEVSTSNPNLGGTTEIWALFDTCTSSSGSITIRSSHPIPSLVSGTPVLSGNYASLSYNATNRTDSSMLITRGIRINNNRVFHEGFMGSGSGLDADKLDGKDSTAFAPSGYGLGTTSQALANGTDLNTVKTTGWYHVNAGINVPPRVTGDNASIWHYIEVISHDSNSWVAQNAWEYSTGVMFTRVNNNGTWTTWTKHWTDNIDGSGSTLDADTLDGLDSLSFVKADGTVPITGDLNISGHTILGQQLVLSGGTATDRVNNSTWYGLGRSNVFYGNNSGGATGVQLAGYFGVNLKTSNGELVLDPSYSSAPKYNGHVIWHSGNQGSGSGLDADTLDSLDSTKFVRSDINSTMNGTLTMTQSITLANNISLLGKNTSGSAISLAWISNTNQIGIGNVSAPIYINSSSSPVYWNGTTNYTMWHQGNQGASSGLDADMIDGQHASSFAPSGYGLGTGGKRLTSGSTLGSLTASGWYDVQNPSDGVTGMSWHGVLNSMTADSNYATQFAFPMVDNTNNPLYVRTKHSGSWNAWNKVWTDLNDGSGSGMDADTVDGIQGSQIVSDTGVILTTQDLNTLTGNGIYRASNWSGNNIPSGAYSYGTLEVLQTNYSVTQNYYTHSNGQNTGMWTRTKWNASDWTVWKKIWTDNNQGASSGLDADTVDSIQASQFVRNDSATTMNVGLLFSPSASTGPNSNTPTALSYGQLQGYGTFNILADTDGSHTEYLLLSSGYGSGSVGNGLAIGYNSLTWKNNVIWHSGNQGSGSGMDADMVDGKHASYFVYNGQNHLFNNMGGGASYDTVDFNNLGIIGEYRFINVGASGTVNKPNDTGMGYYLGMGGGDVANRGFQLLGTSTKNMWFREISNGVWCKIWNDQNMGASSGMNADMVDSIHASQFVRNDTTNQSVGNGFTMSGSAYVGGSSSNGALYIRTGSGSLGIQLAGDGSTQQSGVGVYLNANGTANFSGTMTANAIAVTSTSVVNNLNSQMINSVKEPQLTKNWSIAELGGMGVYTGLQISAQATPNMTTQIGSGTVYTNSGMRIVISSGQSIAFASPSTTYDRIDTVYVQGSSAGNNEGVVTVAQGTASSSPTAPSIPSDGVALANVRVRANAGSILSTDITDIRVWRPFYSNGSNTYVGNTIYIQGTMDSSNNYINLNKPIKNTTSNNSITIPVGSTSYTWTHNLNLTKYTIKLSCNSPEPHVYWSNKTSNAITINLDDVCVSDVIIDISIEAF